MKASCSSLVVRCWLRIATTVPRGGSMLQLCYDSTAGDGGGTQRCGAMSDISEWWPLLHEEIRRWMVNNYWSPVAPYSVSEVERVGGPEADDDFWDQRDGERYLPQKAVRWIVKSPDFGRLTMPKEPDPRAAYFRRGWPYRQD